MPLRVLLADSNSERADALAEKLEATDDTVVLRAAPGSSIADVVGRDAPDVIIVDMTLPDRDALEDIRAVNSHAPRPIVMFVDRDDPGFMEEAIAAGVSSYNVVGMTLPDVKPIVAAAIAIFRRHRQVEEELAQAKAAIEERRMLERAKSILMRRRGIGEPEAYRWLRRKAMNESRRIADVAAEIVATDRSDVASG
jgi:two-component system, response regulator / RNA-binding antiterminator